MLSCHLKLLFACHCWWAARECISVKMILVDCSSCVFLINYAMSSLQKLFMFCARSPVLLVRLLLLCHRTIRATFCVYWLCRLEFIVVLDRVLSSSTLCGCDAERCGLSVHLLWCWCGELESAWHVNYHYAPELPKTTYLCRLLEFATPALGKFCSLKYCGCWLNLLFPCGDFSSNVRCPSLSKNYFHNSAGNFFFGCVLSAASLLKFVRPFQILPNRNERECSVVHSETRCCSRGEWAVAIVFVWQEIVDLSRSSFATLWRHWQPT